MKVCPECKGACRDGDNVCPDCGCKLTAGNLADVDQLIGMTLAGKYELTECLGEGNMGWVYRGVHLALESSVAVKIMKPQLRPDDKRAERFKREAQAASRLNHPHIISVIDFGETPSGLFYIVTEYLRGLSLAQVLEEEGTLDLKRAVRITRQILSALEESHGAGVVHRDMKPGNVMITELRGGGDHVKVLDFGIAKVQDDRGQKLTQHGQLFGTPDYMAPEQVRGKEVTGAADLYAVGVVLFRMLTGRQPFDSEHIFDALRHHLYTKPLQLNETGPEANFSEELQNVVDRALAKDPKDRFENAGAFRTELRTAARSTTGHMKPCPACKKLVSRTVRFCPHCGKTIPDTQALRIKLNEITAEPTLDPSRLGKEIARAGTRESAPTLERLWAAMTLTLPLLERQEEKNAAIRFARSEIKALHLTGPQGIGKTAIARLAAQMARRADMTVRWVEPHPARQYVSWAPVRQAVGQALGVDWNPTEDRLRQTVGNNEDLLRDLPGLSELFDLPSTLTDADPAVRKGEAMAASLRALTLTTTEPTLLIFEDADLYPEPSRGFLARLCRRIRIGPIHVLTTSAVPFMPIEPRAQTLELAPLKDHTVNGLLNQLVSNPSDSWHGIQQKIVHCAEGNPLWLQQALSLATEAGMESDEPLPDLMSTRISRLPGPTQRILQALAVLGVEAPIESVAYLLEEELLPIEHVQIAVHRGLLEHPRPEGRPAPGADVHRPSFAGHLQLPGQTLRFTHPLLVQVVRENIPSEVRQRLAKRALRLMEPLRTHKAVLAHHAVEAGEHEQAVELLETSADTALRAFDPQGASQLYRQAVDVSRWKLLMADEDAPFVRLNVKLGEALHRAGDLKSAQVVLKAAEGCSSRHPVLAARARRGLARIFMDQDRPLKAVELMHRANGDAIKGGNLEMLTEVYLDLAQLVARTGDRDTAVQELSQGVDLLTSGGGPDSPEGPGDMWKLLALASELILQTSEERRSIQTAFAWATAALAHAERVSSLSGMARSHLLLAELHKKSDNEKPASDHFRSALKALRHLGDRRGQAHCLLTGARGGLDIMEGSTRQAYQLASEVDWAEGMELAARIARRQSERSLPTI